MVHVIATRMPRISEIRWLLRAGFDCQAVSRACREETPMGRVCTVKSSVRAYRTPVFRMRISSQAAFPVAVFGLWRCVAPASAHRLLRVLSAYPRGTLARMEHGGYPHGYGRSLHEAS